MKQFLCIALVASVGQAGAAPAPAFLASSPECRFAPLDKVPAGADLFWDGPCQDGYAHGKGVLKWRAGKLASLSGTFVRGEVSGEAELKTSDYTYTGTLRRGVPHGTGYYLYATGAQYEGSVANDKREGNGIMLDVSLTEYKGEWRDGMLNGWGEATFGTGGSYKGQWLDAEPHGHGVMTFAGSGHKFEGRFENGRPAGTRVVASETTKAMIRAPGRTSKLIAPVPLDDNWQMLADKYKETVRNSYPALAPGDEPPYPLKGTRRMFEAVTRLNASAGAAEGELRIYVTVGTDGKARQAKIVRKPTLPDPEDAEKLVKYITGVMMLDEYKPALCQGVPCEMVYPVWFFFSVVMHHGLTAPMFR